MQLINCFSELANKMVPLLCVSRHLNGISESGVFELFFKAAHEKGYSVAGNNEGIVQ